METQQLNNYTIDDFIKLKPVIYEYCLNLTQSKTATSWFRDKAKADDLYQDVYLYVYDNYFNKPRDPVSHGKFVQMMKNSTFWAYHKSTNYVNNKIYRVVNRFDDSPKDFHLFESSRFELPKVFKNIQEHPDYAFYTRGLNSEQKLALNYLLEGYTRAEISKRFDRPWTFIKYILAKIEKNSKSEFYKKPVKIVTSVTPKFEGTDYEFLKKKGLNVERLFKKERHLKMYSMYLQGFGNDAISKAVGKTRNQVNQEIYRLNQKITNGRGVKGSKGKIR